ncbi:hypothetical protein [Curtobacterium sp. 9128]|uniref:hypothetical protein n=1 Tax=Curtobacterium sp. 9128 TaxID=1793722 RepID=UPI0011A97E7D|nr:hypothetical protein [Curtobacterium sp. 9128]
MTRTRSTSDVYPTRASSAYAYHSSVPLTERQVKRATVFPWWIWAVAPFLTVGVVAAMLQAV